MHINFLTSKSNVALDMILDQFSFNIILTKKLTFLYEKSFHGTRAHFFHLHELHLKTKETKNYQNLPD